MIRDPEWEQLQHDFRSVAEAPETATLRLRVARHGRWLRWLLVGELVVAAGLIAAPLAWLGAEPAPWKWAWALTLWGFTAVALAFTTWNRRGVWEPAGESLTAQLELEILRCHRARRTLLFTPLLLLAETVAIVALFQAYFPLALGAVWSPLAACAAGVAVWAALFERWIRLRLTRAEALRREIAGA